MKFIFFIIIFLLSPFSYSQKRERSSEFGGALGISYYTGELNPPATGQFKNIHPALGIIFRRNFNSRISTKTTLNFGTISGNDSQSKRSKFEKSRNLSFKSPLLEGSQQLEFLFFNFKVMDLNQYYSPYLFTGFSFFFFKPRPYGVEKKYLPISSSIPFGAGLRIKLSHRFLVGVEWGYRKTFSDYLDDISKVYPGTSNQRGDSKNTDWYSFSMICLTIRFGEKPNDCYYK